jgi:hypothetical protein
VKKIVLGERICRWLFLFQECDFEVILKQGKLNVGPDHLSWVLTGECAGNLDDSLADSHFFSIQILDDHFVEIVKNLST